MIGKQLKGEKLEATITLEYADEKTAKQLPTLFHPTILKRRLN